MQTEPIQQPPLNRDSVPDQGSVPVYVPPQLTPVGNLRDLLGKTGIRFDFGGTAQLRP